MSTTPLSEKDPLAIGRRSVQGIVALSSRTFLVNLLSYAASLIIFSYLAPSDIGIYVSVLAIQRIISFLSDFGFGAALVQKKDEITIQDIRTTFTIQFFSTLSLFILIVLLRNGIAGYFHLSDKAVGLLLVLVFTIFLSSFKAIPSILLERHIHFHKLIIPQIAESVVFNALLIFLAITLHGLESYTIAFFFSSLVSIPFYYFVSPWKPAFGLYRSSIRHLKFGLQFQMKNVLATLKDDLIMVFLIRILSFAELGYIGFAQRNAFFSYRYVVDSVTKVTFSTYSRLQENKELLQKGIERSLFFVSALMFPVLLGLIITSPYIIQYFPRWQNKWEPAVVSLIFFCLNALVSSLSGILVNVLDATGRVKTTLRLMVMWTILTWVLTIIFVKIYGFHGVSLASFLVTLTIGVTIYMVKSVVSFHFIKSIYKPFISSIVMCTIVYGGTVYVVNNLFGLILTSIVAGIAYFFLLYLLSQDEIKIIKKYYFQRM